MKVIFYNVLISMVLLIGGYDAVAEDLDFYFMQQKVVTSVPLKAMGNAGIAVPAGCGMGWSNPALLYSSVKNKSKGAVSVGYGRDSLFNRHIVPVAISHIDGKGALGGLFRYGSGDAGISQREFGVNFSGELFEKVDIQGAVDFGINIRYLSLVDKRYELQTFFAERWYSDASGAAVLQDTLGTYECQYNGDAYKHHAVVDIGFFQPDIMKHLDFGLVISNCFGYRWNKQHPVLTSADSSVCSTDNECDTLIRTYTYSDESRYIKGWLPGRYRILTLGAAYRFVAEGLHVTLPVDIEMLGLFDKKMENAFIFRGGLVVYLGNAITVRLGYSREPGNFFEGIHTFKNIHVFSGGGGITVGQTTVDCYFTKGAFGVSTQILY